jgi:hypothetical protein
MLIEFLVGNYFQENFRPLWNLHNVLGLTTYFILPLALGTWQFEIRILPSHTNDVPQWVIDPPSAWAVLEKDSGSKFMSYIQKYYTNSIQSFSVLGDNL